MMENLSTSAQIESLFWSVENELVKRWVFHNVPPVFACRPLIHLRVIIKSWWQIYHESRCARLRVNRCIWKRNQTHQAELLDTPSLVASLEEIWRIICLDDLLAFRPLSKAEEASLCLLALLVKFYSNPNSEK